MLPLTKLVHDMYIGLHCIPGIHYTCVQHYTLCLLSHCGRADWCHFAIWRLTPCLLDYSIS